jgi:hypothetical protein
MKKLFVSYEIARRVHNLGFKEDCFGYYNQITHSGKWKWDSRIWENCTDYIDAPMYQQVLDWLREEKNSPIWISPIFDFDGYGYQLFWGTGYMNTNNIDYYNYYAAIDVGLEIALDKLEKESKEN